MSDHSEAPSVSITRISDLRGRHRIPPGPGSSLASDGNWYSVDTQPQIWGQDDAVSQRTIQPRVWRCPGLPIVWFGIVLWGVLAVVGVPLWATRFAAADTPLLGQILGYGVVEVLIGGSALLMYVALVRPRLVASEAGLYVRNVRDHTIPWSEVESFLPSRAGLQILRRDGTSVAVEALGGMASHGSGSNPRAHKAIEILKAMAADARARLGDEPGASDVTDDAPAGSYPRSCRSRRAAMVEREGVDRRDRIGV
jgi:hypothetical protein